jgi:hypothetical protein
LADDGPTDHRRVGGAHKNACVGYVIRASVGVTFTRKRIEAQVGGDDEVVLWGSGQPTRESSDVDDLTELAFGNRTIRSLDGDVV